MALPLPGSGLGGVPSAFADPWGGGASCDRHATLMRPWVPDVPTRLGLARRGTLVDDGFEGVGVMERPRVEADGSLSWLPVDAEPLAVLTVRRRQAAGGWLTTVHCHPAEIFRSGHRFYIRRPKRDGRAWHTVLLDAEELHARVDRVETPAGPAATLIIE